MRRRWPGLKIFFCKMFPFSCFGQRRSFSCCCRFPWLPGFFAAPLRRAEEKEEDSRIWDHENDGGSLVAPSSAACLWPGLLFRKIIRFSTFHVSLLRFHRFTVFFRRDILGGFSGFFAWDSNFCIAPNSTSADVGVFCSWAQWFFLNSFNWYQNLINNI